MGLTRQKRCQDPLTRKTARGFRGCGHKELWKHFLLHSEPQPVPKLSAGFNNALNSPPTQELGLYLLQKWQ